MSNLFSHLMELLGMVFLYYNDAFEVLIDFPTIGGDDIK